MVDDTPGIRAVRVGSVLMTDKLSEFLAEHKASEFGLAPVSKAMAIKMAVALEQRVEELEGALKLIASDALWHDGIENPEALEDIRKTVKSLGYTKEALAEEEATPLVDTPRS